MNPDYQALFIVSGGIAMLGVVSLLGILYAKHLEKRIEKLRREEQKRST